MSIEKERDAERRFMRNVMEAMAKSAAASPIDMAHAILAIKPTLQDLPMTDNAVSHFITSLSHELASPDRETPYRSADTNLIACCQALNDVLIWTSRHPAQAKALDQAIHNFMTQNELLEAHFISRTAQANFNAVDQAQANADALGAITAGLAGPPSQSADGLLIIAKYAAKAEDYELRASLDPGSVDENGHGYIYDMENHFDHTQTKIWSTTLARLADPGK